MKGLAETWSAASQYKLLLDACALYFLIYPKICLDKAYL